MVPDQPRGEEVNQTLDLAPIDDDARLFIALVEYGKLHSRLIETRLDDQFPRFPAPALGQDQSGAKVFDIRRLVHTMPLMRRRMGPRLSMEAERPLIRWKPTAAVWKASAPWLWGPGPWTGWPIALLW